MPETTGTKPEPPVWQQESFWLSVLAVVAAVPSIIDPILPLMPDDWRPVLLGISGVCAALAARFARIPGAEARAALPGVQATAETAVEAAGIVNERVNRMEQEEAPKR